MATPQCVNPTILAHQSKNLQVCGLAESLAVLSTQEKPTGRRIAKKITDWQHVKASESFSRDFPNEITLFALLDETQGFKFRSRMTTGKLEVRRDISGDKRLAKELL